MIEIVQATFQDGVFKPDKPPSFHGGTRVRMVVESVATDDESNRAAAWASLQEIWRHSRLDSQGDRLSREQLHARR